MQTALLGFQRARSGLLVPSPGGLTGFQRQGMDQRKKASGPSFIGVDFTTTLGAPLPIPTAAIPGDLLIYQANANSSSWVPSNDASWTTLSKTDVGGTARWKIMDGNDRQATVPGAGSAPGAAIWAFRNVASLAQVAQLGDNTGGGIFGSAFAMTGFTKHARHLGLFVFGESSSAATHFLAAPTALAASRTFFYTPADRVAIAGNYPRAGAYTLNPLDYQSGATITWDVGNTTWGQAFCAVMELRGN